MAYFKDSDIPIVMNDMVWEIVGLYALPLQQTGETCLQYLRDELNMLSTKLVVKLYIE